MVVARIEGPYESILRCDASCGFLENVGLLFVLNLIDIFLGIVKDILGCRSALCYEEMFDFQSS